MMCCEAVNMVNIERGYGDRRDRLSYSLSNKTLCLCPPHSQQRSQRSQNHRAGGNGPLSSLEASCTPEMRHPPSRREVGRGLGMVDA